MKELFARAEPVVYAALRVVVGAFMMLHGLQKLFGVLGMDAMPVGSQLWIGAVIEAVGGTLVMLGLGTRCAAFVVSGQMAVAYFQFHWRLDMSHFKWVPLVNKGELAVVYCFAFLFFCVHGPGPFSLDRAITSKT
jgi:putative oxidoreductase